MVVLILAVH